MIFNADVHQAHKELYVGWGNLTDLWGNLTDFQFCIDNFQFSVQWYDFHIMNLISRDDGILLFLLMNGMRQKIPWDPNILGNDRFPKRATIFGYLQLRKWDPTIFLSGKLCWKAFSLKGVQFKQWGPFISYFWRNFTCFLDRASQPFFCT